MLIPVILFVLAGSFYFFLPKVVLLGDVAYEWGDYAYNERAAKWALLKMGYRLEYLRVPTLPANAKELDALLSKQVLHAKVVIATPMLSLSLLQAEKAKSEVLSKIIGMGDVASASGKFRSALLFDPTSGWNSAVTYLRSLPLATAIIEDGSDLLNHEHFSVFNKRAGESDQFFASRTLKSMQEQSVLNIVSPSLGYWAVDLAKESSLMWALDAKDSPVIDKKHLLGVVADDLAGTLPQLLRQLDQEQGFFEVKAARVWIPVKGTLGSFSRFAL